MTKTMNKAHPVKGVLAVRRISQREAAAAIGCGPAYLCSVINGTVTASADLRQRLATYLDASESELFHELRCSYCGRSGPA